MRHFYFLILFFTIALQAQIKTAPDLSKYKKTEEKLTAWAHYCDKYLFVEDYQGLRKVARKGLLMSPERLPGHISVFNFYIGVTFNYGTETDSAVYYLEKSELYGRKAHNEGRIEQALMQLLNAYNTYGNVTKKQRVLNELETRADTIKDQHKKADMDGNISTYYTDAGEYEKGLQFRLESIGAKRTFIAQGDHNDSINFGVALINVAELYLEMKNAEKTKEYLNESNFFIKDYQDGVATIYKDFTSTALLENNATVANENYRKLSKFLEAKTDNMSWGILIEADLAFADYYLSKKDNQAALNYAKHARRLSKYADNFQLAKTNHLSGKIYFALHQYEKALGYLNEAEPITKEDSAENQAALQKTLSETYAALGNWKEAYHHYNRYSQIEDNLLNERAKSNLAKMEAQFQNKKKQGEINMLSAENTIKSLQIKDAGRQRVYLIIGLLLLLIIISSLVVIYRNKQKSSRILEQKNDEMKRLNQNLETANRTKAKLFSIISHDLRSPISHIYQFLDLQKTEPELFSEADKLRHNERISEAANTVLETMEDLLIWSKSQMQQFTVSNEKVNLSQCVESIIDLIQAQIRQKSMVVAVGIPETLTIHSDRNILTIIIRNLLQNAVKYAPENSKIDIGVHEDDAQITISIADEGHGLPEHLKGVFSSDSININSNQSGLGLTLVREMAELISAQISLTDNHPNGTIAIVAVKTADSTA